MYGSQLPTEYSIIFLLMLSEIIYLNNTYSIEFVKISVKNQNHELSGIAVKPVSKSGFHVWSGFACPNLMQILTKIFVITHTINTDIINCYYQLGCISITEFNRKSAINYYKKSLNSFLYLIVIQRSSYLYLYESCFWQPLFEYSKKLQEMKFVQRHYLRPQILSFFICASDWLQRAWNKNQCRRAAMWSLSTALSRTCRSACLATNAAPPAALWVPTAYGKGTVYILVMKWNYLFVIILCMSKLQHPKLEY